MITMNPQWDEYLQTASKLILGRESYQKLLGKISAAIAEEYGLGTLFDFSKAIEDSTGLRISPTTLRNYRWVWDKTHDLGLPEDFPYRAYQAIAGSDDPKKWAKAIQEQGLTPSDVILGIKEEKGITDEKKKKVIKCPKCQNEFEV